MFFGIVTKHRTAHHRHDAYQRTYRYVPTRSTFTTKIYHKQLTPSSALTTSKTNLVPYSPHHVPTYHTWMQDADLQAATASEPLSLPEEYAMQQSWRSDADKLTFIVCLAREEFANSTGVQAAAVQGGVDDRSERMIGDINLFLFEPEDEDDDEDDVNPTGTKEPSTSTPIVGEIELMIARKDLHRQGYGRAALLSFMGYILDSWARIAAEYGNGVGENVAAGRKLEYLRVKINQSNERSIALFKSVGFEQTAAGANYFGEVELRWKPVREELVKGRGWEEVSVVKYVEP